MLSLLGKVVLLGGLNGGNVSISLTMNIFHICVIRCPFFWVGCYMYPKRVCADFIKNDIEREKSLIQNVEKINK
jgi:hypothetical protein